ncbi:MAG: hypothetical protein IPL09_05265 [Bacteroidetes bacterium]|nr:hypothetical protein [Bacteroidota bacterium]HQW45510.1 hypothetical protein [Chitinophagaceae bacterium]MBK6820438.1 hypothetical protein [Bacteroidota bacterium]MBK7041040.1 hypothetical protein [Bacteroidota bacterium]MBK7587796.1 hypothetical protein [Bacteroidota bacterium]
MKSLDLLIGIFYAFVILFVGLYYANRKYQHDKYTKNNFILSLGFKLFSGILFGALYQFYYKYGDSINYLIAGKEYFDYILTNPAALIDFIFLDQKVLDEKYHIVIENSLLIFDYFINSNIIVHKFVLILGLFTGYLFFPLCVLFSFISFIGCWKIYRTLSQLYPQYEKYFKISFLYLPSVIFWTAGIGKDAICLGFINLFAAFIIEAFIFKKHFFRNMLWCFFFLYVTYTIKSYIVLSFVPLFIFFIFTTQVKKIHNTAKKWLIKGVFMIFVLAGALFLLLNNTVSDKITEDVVGSALFLTQGQQNTESGNDSKYDLGITLDDIRNRNIKPYILPAVVVALFRPYIWEVNKPFIIFSFVESCFFLFFTMYVFIKGYVIRTLQIVLKNEFVLFCILYTIIFAFFVGLVSANFGTLIRYKTPFISYFLIALFIIKDTLNAKKPISIVPPENV